jgi:hypothetical protein
MVVADAPRGELGAQAEVGSRSPWLQPGAAASGWSAFTDSAEYVPELRWPSSIVTYDRVRNDSQVEALYLGTTLPIRAMTWTIDPNGAPAALTKRLASDVGLPVRGQEDAHVPRSSYRFNFDEWLGNALLALVFGHFYFEVVGEVNAAATEWHLRKLAPRHPRTLQEINVAADGGLVGIRQNIAGQPSANDVLGVRMPPLIPVNRLVAFVWGREAGSWVGRSMLRSIYREWLVKDRTMRVAAINVERAGGVPTVIGPEGASDAQLRDLAQMARQFKVSEGGGGALPFGSKLELASAGGADGAVNLIRYCDEAMARVWALMLVQLGQTETGSRALGGTFADYAASAQDAIAGWVRRVFDEHVASDYVEWNLGPDAEFAPRLHCEPSSAATSTADMAALVAAGLLTVDPELRAWIRNERGLPEEPEPETDPALGELTPAERDLVLNSRNPPAIPPAAPAVSPAAAPEPAPPAPAPVAASALFAARRRDPLVRAALTLPTGRELRRNPSDVEVRAAVDFAELDRVFETALTDAEMLYREQVIPQQIEALALQVVVTKAGTDRKVVTRQAMAALNAPTAGRDALVEILLAAARSGAVTVAGELASQGLAVAEVSDETLRAAVGDAADAMSSMAANGISLAAQRKAVQMVGGRSPADVAAGLREHLAGMAHQWTVDQLRGTVQMAQNVGRVKAAETVADPVVPFASELLDTNTCGPCMANDGREYGSLEAAARDYASGGFVACEGGPRCRGTLVLVSAAEVNPDSHDPARQVGALA